jgi:hypothetical protein
MLRLHCGVREFVQELVQAGVAGGGPGDGGICSGWPADLASRLDDVDEVYQV